MILIDINKNVFDSNCISNIVLCLSFIRGFREIYGVKSFIGGISNNCNWGDF